MATVRDIEGVHPSYFASMPGVALDPNAGKPNPQYAQLLSQAMQDRAQATDRRRENDEANVFKAREQSQQARRDRRSNEISKRNAAVNEAGEARLKSGQDVQNERTKDEDKRKLMAAAIQAHKNGDEVTFGYLTKELRKHGVYLNVGGDESPADFEKRDPRLASPANPPPAPPAAPPVDRTPVGPRPGPPPPTASFPPAGEAEAAPPMRAAPAGVAPRATASFPPTNGAPSPGPAPAPRQAPPAAAAAPSMSGWPAAPAPTDDSAFFQAPFDRAGLEAGLDRAMPTDQQILNAYIAETVRREKAGLPPAPTPKPLLPGKSLRRQAAESDQMLAPGDPLLGGPRAQ